MKKRGFSKMPLKGIITFIRNTFLIRKDVAYVFICNNTEIAPLVVSLCITLLNLPPCADSHIIPGLKSDPDYSHVVDFTDDS